MSFKVGDKVRIRGGHRFSVTSGTFEVVALNEGRYPGFGGYGLAVGDWPTCDDGDLAYFYEDELEEA